MTNQSQTTTLSRKSTFQMRSNNDDAQVVTKCNICGQGEYVETNRTEIESITEPVYQAVVEEAIKTAIDPIATQSE